MKKSIIILIILLSTILEVVGTPAVKLPLLFKQSDASEIELYLFGDEFVHYYVTVDGIPVFNKDGDFFYGFLQENELIISNVNAHAPERRTKNESAFIHTTKKILSFLTKCHKEKLKDSNFRRVRNKNFTRGVNRVKNYEGEKRGLVILVNFSNLSMLSENATYDFNRIFNERGYSENGCIGSVHDYFADQSYGEFDLKFDVVGPVNLKETYGYYGTNNFEYGMDKRAVDMVIEACNLVDDEVDFSKYDWDGDGEVDQVYIIYAGYGEHAGAPANTIWPHESNLGIKSINLDGVKINTYACSCELAGRTGTQLSGIGTPCHEFSHCLGLPDLYDTDYSGAFGMDVWDLMNSGSYSGPTGNGEVPYGYSAYERWVCGWLEPVRIDTSTTISGLKNLEEFPEAYIIYNEGDENEYFILENHQPTKWYQYIGKHQGAHGLMVTHVDYDPTAWKLNTVNPKPEHQRMTIVPADRSYGYSEEELLGDLYPGFGDVKWFTSESHNAAGGRLFNKNSDGSYLLRCAVSRITEVDDEISFEVWYDYELTTPVVKSALKVDETGFTANWEPLDEAESYTLEIKTKKKIHGFPLERTKIIDNIEATSQRAEWIFEDGETHYRVRGVVHGIPTGWSEYMPVVNDSGVDYFEVDEVEVDYLTTDGVRRNSLVKGINIIRKGNKYEKIFVK